MSVAKALILIPILFVASVGQQREISATVTYVAAGNVFVNAGRVQGVEDSSTAVVLQGGRVLTTLRLEAASSRSSSWVADSAIQRIRVGDIARIRVDAMTAPTPTIGDTSVRATATTLLDRPYRRPETSTDHAAIEFQGRAGAQIFAMSFDDPSLNVLQAGVVLSFRAKSRDLPIKLDLYSNLRDVSRGSAGPLSARSANASRIYRLTLEYDDAVNVVTLGRMAVPLAPTIGILDGLIYARRWKGLTAGTGIGLQPRHDLLGTDTERRKALLFVVYQPPAWTSATFSGAYAKTWYKGASEREAVNATAGAAVSDRLSLWASTDVDLRVTEGGVHHFSPSLSLMLVSATWRVSEVLSITGGADASRSVLPYSFARLIPDSMTDRSLRSGLTLSASWAAMRGMNVTASLTPRMTDGSFNGEYAGSAAVSSYGYFGGSVGFRLQGLLTQSIATEGRGYGATASAHALSADWTARFQQIHYRLKRGGSTSLGSTVGFDVMVPIIRPLSWLVSIDLVRGFGSTSRSMFTELSYRF